MRRGRAQWARRLPGRWSRCALALAMLMGVAGVALQAADSASASVPAFYGTGDLMAADPSGGYWTATATGVVVPYGGAPQLGNPATSGVTLNKPIVGMVATVDGDGYWLVASDGGIFSYGNAPFYGSTGSIHLNKPIVGMAPTPNGDGYWLVASDGGIFSYGNAPFYGSTGSIHLNKPIVGMAATADGGGYWMVASDGGIFSYGNAPFYGSTGSIHLNKPIVGMAPTPDDGGYWMVASDGGLFTFGDAPFYGSLGGAGSSALGLVITASTGGYSIVTSDGSAHQFGPTTPGAPPSPPATTTSTTTTTNPPPPTTSTTSTTSTTTTTTTQPPSSTSSSSGMTTGFYSAAIQGGTAQNDCAPTTTPTATVDSTLDSVFADQEGPGWLGGDASYSTALPNGQEAFAFSDTLIGTAQPDGQASLTGLPHSSELTGTMSDLSTDVGGTEAAPQALIPDAGTDSWQTGAVYMEGGTEQVFVNEFAPVSGSLFDDFTGRAGIASFSLSSGQPVFENITLLPTGPYDQWGNAMTQSGGYDDVYGLSMDNATDTFYGMKVGRVPVGDSTDPSAWTFWNGTSWVPGEANAYAAPGFPLIDGVVPLENGSGFMGTGTGGSGTTMSVGVTFSCSPTGPWSTPVNIYTIPEVSEYPDEWAYMATFHPELAGNGLVASYDINSLDGLSALEQNDHLYQPRFIDIHG
jgi:hypothetical protein